ncbi:DNA-directed RNA polymerase I subunit RPA12 [Cimex lectularius]|uniref:DNA-directed RNA polymerase subunit n=1 Tax=Cimex lectularius TaxID=79782 RepID=A0A8I6S077_CIMLE|nr:DNA-directed RNA polymerase I subunit RPA12 [Cimex lectularius]
MSGIEPGFCPDCGSILPLLEDVSSVQCYSCKRIFDHEAFGTMESSYTIHFNTYTKARNVDQGEDEGPIVERRCPKCNNDKMSYATIQLRSADEGQTVFYTCTKCRHKETENS